MTLLQQLKDLRSEGYADAKEVFPFVMIEIHTAVYDSDGERMDEDAYDVVEKLSKRNVDSAIESAKNLHKGCDEIYVCFVYRGADNMTDFKNYETEYVDGAEKGLLVSLKEK